MSPFMARSDVSLRCQSSVAIGAIADIGRASRTCRSDAIDPSATLAGSKSRSAAGLLSISETESSPAPAPRARLKSIFGNTIDRMGLLPHSMIRSPTQAGYADERRFCPREGSANKGQGLHLLFA